MRCVARLGTCVLFNTASASVANNHQPSPGREEAGREKKHTQSKVVPRYTPLIFQLQTPILRKLPLPPAVLPALLGLRSIRRLGERTAAPLLPRAIPRLAVYGLALALLAIPTAQFRRRCGAIVAVLPSLPPPEDGSRFIRTAFLHVSHLQPLDAVFFSLSAVLVIL